jgi:hypothetical protein
MEDGKFIRPSCSEDGWWYVDRKILNIEKEY